jgi:hypothetical protein
MSKPKKYKFVFGDGTDHDATVSEISLAQEICQRYGWSIAVKQTALGNEGGGWTIEVSNDGINFYNYKVNAVGIAIIDAYDDEHLDWTYMRINYDAQTETAGTVEFEITLKQS